MKQQESVLLSTANSIIRTVHVINYRSNEEVSLLTIQKLTVYNIINNAILLMRHRPEKTNSLHSVVKVLVYQQNILRGLSSST